MENISWGLLMLGSLMLFCAVIVVISSVYVVWLLRLVYCAVLNKPIPTPPFSPSRSKGFDDS